MITNVGVLLPQDTITSGLNSINHVLSIGSSTEASCKFFSILFRFVDEGDRTVINVSTCVIEWLTI